MNVQQALMTVNLIVLTQKDLSIVFVMMDID